MCDYIFAYELEGLGEALIYTQTYTIKGKPHIYTDNHTYTTRMTTSKRLKVKDNINKNRILTHCILNIVHNENFRIYKS